MDPGSRDDLALLQVSCPPNKFYDKFVVQLGAGGSWYTWVDQTYTDIPTSATWKKWSSEIPVVDTNYNLADYDYTIQEVFASGSGWWSGIKVIPIYPLYHDVQIRKKSDTEFKATKGQSSKKYVQSNKKSHSE